MKTVKDDCQFVCITQTDYYKILSEGKLEIFRTLLKNSMSC